MALSAHQEKIKAKLEELAPQIDGNNLDIWVTAGNCEMAEELTIKEIGLIAYNTYVAASSTNKYLLLAESKFLASQLPITALKVMGNITKAAPGNNEYGQDNAAPVKFEEIAQMREWWIARAKESIEIWKSTQDQVADEDLPYIGEYEGYYNENS